MLNLGWCEGHRLVYEDFGCLTIHYNLTSPTIHQDPAWIEQDVFDRTGKFSFHANSLYTSLFWSTVAWSKKVMKLQRSIIINWRTLGCVWRLHIKTTYKIHNTSWPILHDLLSSSSRLLLNLSILLQMFTYPNRGTKNSLLPCVDCPASFLLDR